MPMVKIDYGLLEQALYNLLYNSTQYAPVASIIELSTSYDDCTLIIRVIDSGPGFPEEAIENVFKKFFRVDGSKTGGLGLGLSIVKGFVEAHKGTVTVENRKVGGSEFTLKIPTENPDIQNLQLETE
jgi:two-component system sensor histidine kinase KdpD